MADQPPGGAPEPLPQPPGGNPFPTYDPAVAEAVRANPPTSAGSGILEFLHVVVRSRKRTTPTKRRRRRMLLINVFGSRWESGWRSGASAAAFSFVQVVLLRSLTDIGPGHLTCSLPITPALLNPFGAAHGGVLSVLVAPVHAGEMRPTPRSWSCAGAAARTLRSW